MDTGKAGHLFGPRLRGGIFCSGNNNTKNGIKTTKGAKPRLVVGTHTQAVWWNQRENQKEFSRPEKKKKNAHRIRAIECDRYVCVCRCVYVRVVVRVCTRTYPKKKKKQEENARHFYSGRPGFFFLIQWEMAREGWKRDGQNGWTMGIQMTQKGQQQPTELYVHTYTSNITLLIENNNPSYTLWTREYKKESIGLAVRMESAVWNLPSQKGLSVLK